MSPNLIPQSPREPIEDVYSLQNELDGCIFRHVKGFYPKYFEEKSWSATAKRAAQKVQSAATSHLCSGIIEAPCQGSVSVWLARFQPTFLPKEQIQSHFRSRTSNLGNPMRTDIYLGPLDQLKSDSTSTAANVRVFGEINSNHSSTESEDVLRFCESARQVFQDPTQSTRRFLHGFQICGSMMELWVFDRSGAYSSDKLNIRQRPDLLIQTIASYMMMNDEEVGFNPFIQLDGLKRYIAFRGIDGNERFYLEEKPIATPQYIVGPGTTCYASRGLTSKFPEYVVKFAWREGEGHTERELLESTKDRNVWGVIKLLGCQDLESIESLRQSLQFTEPYDFRSTAADRRHASEGHGAVTFTGFNDNYPQPFVNRTLSCVMTSPLGRPINKFESILEFLEACRDVVKALRSLYQDGKILHRDICIKNLIISSRPQEGDAKGVLIDLDGALDLSKGPARKGELIGSEGFMAIGILTGDPHTYRHDLESLFYVFLWIAICKDREHDDQESLRYQPKTSRLWGWCSTDFKSVSRNKIIDMSPDGFLRILNEFSKEFEHLEGLAKEINELLFPVRDGQLFTGTDMDQEDRLYDEMINAFNRSIASQANGNL